MLQLKAFKVISSYITQLKRIVLKIKEVISSYFEMPRIICWICTNISSTLTSSIVSVFASLSQLLKVHGDQQPELLLSLFCLLYGGLQVASRGKELTCHPNYKITVICENAFCCCRVSASFLSLKAWS